MGKDTVEKRLEEYEAQIKRLRQIIREAGNLQEPGEYIGIRS